MIQNINIGGRINKGIYQYTLQSSDTETLYRVAPELREKVSQIPGLLDVNTDLYVTNPQMMIEVDREKAAAYGITVDQVRQELFNAFGSRQVATIYTQSNDYQVILEAKPEFRNDPSKLASIYIKTTGGGTAMPAAGMARRSTPASAFPASARLRQSIPLTAVTTPVTSVGPLLVNHQGQQPSVTISFNLAPGTTIGQATDAIRQLERESTCRPRSRPASRAPPRCSRSRARASSS